MIASYSQFIEKRYIDKLDQQGITFLDYIVEDAKRMQELINNLLMVSRVGTRGKYFSLIYSKKPFELAFHNLVRLVNETKTKISCPTHCLPSLSIRLNSAEKIFRAARD